MLFRSVTAGAAVDVDIEEGGRQGAFGQSHVAAWREGRLGLRGDGRYPAVFDENDGPLDDPVGAEQLLCRQDCAHIPEYRALLCVALLR